jgi:BolA protein
MINIIRLKLTAALEPLTLDIVDESHKHAGHAGARPEGNSHFHLRIVSAAFTPLSRVERHRLVHDLLKEELEGPIHALSLTLQSPEEAL